MTTLNAATLTPGCLIEGSAVHTAEEVDRLTCQMAIGMGWNAPSDVTGALAAEAPDDDEDFHQNLSEMASEAVDFINDVLPTGMYATFDDGLRIYPAGEDD
jgi:hypothetical protein